MAKSREKTGSLDPATDQDPVIEISSEPGNSFIRQSKQRRHTTPPPFHAVTDDEIDGESGTQYRIINKRGGLKKAGEQVEKSKDQDVERNRKIIAALLKRATPQDFPEMSAKMILANLPALQILDQSMQDRITPALLEILRTRDPIPTLEEFEAIIAELVTQAEEEARSCASSTIPATPEAMDPSRKPDKPKPPNQS